MHVGFECKKKQMWGRRWAHTAVDVPEILTWAQKQLIYIHSAAQASYYHSAWGCNHSPERWSTLCPLTQAQTSAAIDCFAGIQKAFSLPKQAEAGVCRWGLRASQRAKVLTLREGEVRPGADGQAKKPITASERVGRGGVGGLWPSSWVAHWAGGCEEQGWGGETCCSPAFSLPASPFSSQHLWKKAMLAPYACSTPLSAYPQYWSRNKGSLKPSRKCHSV